MSGTMLLAASAGFTLGVGLLLLAAMRGFAGAVRRRRLSPLLRLQKPSRLALWWRRLLQSIGGVKLERQIRLAGRPWGLNVSSFQLWRVLLCACALIGSIFSYMPSAGQGVTLSQFPLFRCMMMVALLWFVPYVLLAFEVKRKRTLLLYELSRLSHRLSVVVTGKTDLRDAVLRAGRTSRLLRPLLTELATGWNTGQYAAIVAFGEAIGLSEAYPLVNTLLAASRVEASEVAAMLEQQVESIDKSMEHETIKRIENVPLYLVLLIMMPFTVVFVLMIYPWMTYMSELLVQAF